MASLVGAGNAYTAFNWYVVNNVWNANHLTYGQDYQLTGEYDPADVTQGTTFNWSFPTSGSANSNPILAYPEVAFVPTSSSNGTALKATGTGNVFPLQVGGIQGMKANYDVSYSGNTQGFNVAFDIWLNKNPAGDHSTASNEIMVWLHKGGIAPFGTLIGTYSDANFSGKIYYSAEKHYTAIISDSDLTTGYIDIDAILAKLETLGIVSPSEYLTSVELGAEVVGGAGSFTVNALGIDVATSAANTTVTGTGLIETPVVSAVSATLDAVHQNLTLSGTANIDGTGNALDNHITGNAGNNVLNGGAGNDVLNGGAGADKLIGGSGNDTFIVDGGDTVIEAVGGGNDTVLTDVSFTLQAGQEIEVLQARTINLGTGITLTGNEFNNIITGNAGANTIDGGAGDDILNGGSGNDTLIGGLGNDRLDGGTGADVLIGGLGSDTYIITDYGDTVVETAGGGVDTILTDVSFTLTAGQEIEYLQTYHTTATTALSLTGNEFNNNITGNAGNNILDGGAGNDVLDGGAGNDILIGGSGNDTYVVDAGDTIVEAAGGGTDTVMTDVSFTLQYGQEIENLQAYRASATTAIKLVGNQLNNFIAGNAGDNILDGGDGNDILNGGAGNDTLIGGNGKDMFVVDSMGDKVIEAVGGGIDTVVTDVSYALGAGQEIEYLQARNAELTLNINLTGNEFANIITGNAGQNVLDGGDGNDTLYGGAGNDVLKGGNGNDTLDGGTGADIMNGGYGNDTYIIDSMGDSVIEAYGGGTDYVLSDVSYTVQGGQEIEYISARTASGTAAIALTGNDYAQTITGNAGNNILDGGGGNDILIGGAGNDILKGGAGNDTFVVDSGDSVYEAVGGGADTVLSDSNFTLTAGQEIENLQAYHQDWTTAISLIGNEYNNFIKGNAGNNILNGGAGDDVLNGGLGDDVMIGGKGKDTFVVDSVNDKVYEAVGEGTDFVLSDISYSLLAGQEIEYLQARDATLTTAINFTGNEFANILIGNAGDNILDGGAGNDILNGGLGNDTLIGGAGNDIFDGGAGNDILRGGAGNDTFNVDAGDKVYEAVGDGIDYVQADVSYSLLAGQEIEYLTARTASGTAAINLTGNEFANTITGNAGNNILDGGDGNDVLDGGAGNDMLKGGAGNDTFIVDSGDTVIEAIGGGIDTVMTDSSFTLGAGQEIENLQAYRPTGTAAINLTGNEFANYIAGNAGNNILDGGAGKDVLNGGAGDDILIGGAGNDTLKGGDGADTFVFRDGDMTNNVWSTDNIVDFSHAQGDKIDLSAIDANGSVAGNQAFTLHSSGTDYVAGAVWLVQAGDTTTVNMDLDGDGKADYVLQVHSVNTNPLVASDFVF